MIGSASAMTSLFRPWTEEASDKSAVEGITTLFPGSQPEVPSSPPPGVEDSSSRENRYKSVKEHMKKRSEKYLLKKLKVQREAKVADFPKSAAPTLPPCCAPTEGFLPPFDWLPSVGFPGGEFAVDATLAHGFPPNLFEEYARFLTEQQKAVSERSRKQRPKKFRCPHCHVGFSNNGQLKGHIRIHTGERPFKCDAESCGKSFTRNEELTRHRRIHSGLRPFPCPECGKRFGRKDHLKKHVKTHFQQRYQLVPILPSHCPYFYGL